MTLRFDPFRELDRLAASMMDANRAPRVMPMDLYRSGDHYVLNADLPGVDPGSVDVNVDGPVLTIRAERTIRDSEKQGQQWLAQERPSGSFLRQINLGDGLDLSKISATYENGVLTVTIPVSEQAKPRRIQVQHSDRGARTISSEKGHQAVSG